MQNKQKSVFSSKIQSVTLILLALFLVFFKANAQDEVNKINVTTNYNVPESRKKCVSISLDIMDILYQGISNPISIKAEGVDDEKISATVTNGTIRKRLNGEYLVDVKTRDYCSVLVWLNGKEIARKEFRVKKIPLPTAFCHGSKGGLISKERIATFVLVAAGSDDFIYQVIYKILGFTVARMSYNKGVIEASSKSAMLTAKQRHLLRNVRSRDKIIFYNIIALGPDSTKMELNPLIFKIK